MTIDFSATGKQLEPMVQVYNWKDTALYAIGLCAGCGDLDFLLETKSMKVLPTFGVIPAFQPVMAALQKTGGDLVTLLHSGQRTELYRPFPSKGEMRTTAKIDGIFDMKIGALVLISTETQVDGIKTAGTSWQLLLRGEGGFGGERPPKLLNVRPAQGASPAFRVEVPTMQNQALLYRLNGDINPIHSDPAVAAKAGFERPILHGLCSYGIAASVTLKELAGNDPKRFRAFEARFAKVVMPGDTLIVEGFPLEEKGRAAVTVTIKESGEKAISSALFEYE